MSRVWPLVFCVGCRSLLGIDEAVPLVTDATLHDGSGTDVVDSGRDPDAPPAGDDVAHVLPEDEYLGTGDLQVTTDLSIDTTNLTATPGLPPGVTLTAAPQDGGGPELAILRVGTLEVASGVRVRAIGGRPLVVLALALQIDGILDAAAIHEVPGAGGSLAGPGAGGPGLRVREADGGGGGGSFGVRGARGGNAPCTIECTPDQTAMGGVAGLLYDSGLGRLQGGSGGGAAMAPAQPTVCPAGLAGAGGGALQLYARSAIAIGATGVISAGGGGGRGGFRCEPNWLAGNGGGSGGAIFLQAPTITNGGMIAANGGAGGSGAGTGGNGIDGEDARPSTGIAAGGPAVGGRSARGGNGGANSGDSQNGNDSSDSGNGGGGGGAVGQLVVFYRTLFSQGTTSPPPLVSTY
ncbi:MAG: hypothetical protein WKG01_15610 [Kofleriaceae bacterium]